MKIVLAGNKHEKRLTLTWHVNKFKVVLGALC